MRIQYLLQVHDQFRQCHECGSIVPVYELKKEATIKDVVETLESPFDQSKDFLGIDNRKARKKRERQKELDDIKDDDLKRDCER